MIDMISKFSWRCLGKANRHMWNLSTLFLELKLLKNVNNELLRTASESTGEFFTIFSLLLVCCVLFLLLWWSGVHIYSFLKWRFCCKDHSNCFEIYRLDSDASPQEPSPFPLEILGNPFHLLYLTFFLCRMGYLASSSTTNASHHNRYGSKCHFNRLGAKWRERRWKRQTRQFFWIRHWWWWRLCLQHQ